MFADWNSGYEYISVVFVACAIYKIEIFFEIWKDDSLNFNENNRNSLVWKILVFDEGTESADIATNEKLLLLDEYSKVKLF
jgi:hypothetical protein